jgi:hypothetical protein
MNKRLLAAAAVALLIGLALAFPFTAMCFRVVLESLRPQSISWNAKNAWNKCEGAIAGTVDWPPAPASACAAMHMCANETTLTPAQQRSLVSAIRRLPDCGDP